MFVSISGSRYFEDYEYFSSILDVYDITSVSVGDCKTGVDKMTLKFCEERQIPVSVKIANWTEYGRAAGPIRNKEVVDNTELLIAFAGKNSKGTKSAIDIAKRLKIPVERYDV